MEDLQRVLENGGLMVSTQQEKGRCLFTTRDFYPGEVIISQEPYVSVPNNSGNDSRCDRCFVSINLKRCSGCHIVWYCGSGCQKLEWKLHHLECGALSRLEKDRRKAVTSSLRLMLKLIIRKKCQSEKILPTTATDNYSLLEALVAHMSNIDEKQMVMYAQMANLVSLILQWPDLNIKEIAENFSKMFYMNHLHNSTCFNYMQLACNAHTICDSELRPLGTGLYPVISIINHSCLPNSVLVFEGKTAVVRAVAKIPKGEEVLISYIETAASTMARQKALEEQYFFNCTCIRCVKVGQPDDMQESAILEGYSCKNEKCEGYLLRDHDDKRFICQQCGLFRKNEEIKDIAGEIKSLTNKAFEFMTGRYYEDAISVYEKIEKLQRKLCHPFSINLLQTREKLLKMLMELENWREALKYCRLTIPAYHRMYPGFHPLLGLQYYTCGKLEWLLGDTEDAVRDLTMATDILRVTHGTETSFMKELIIKLEEARAESSYKHSPSNE